MKSIASGGPAAVEKPTQAKELVHKVMSLSALHISVDTWQLLNIRHDNGLRVVIDLLPAEIAQLRDDISEDLYPDLYNCIEYAVKSGCCKLIFGENDTIQYGLRVLDNETQEMVPTYSYIAAHRTHTPGRGITYSRHTRANGMGSYDGTDMLETIYQHPRPRNYLARTYIRNGERVTEVYDAIYKKWNLQKNSE